MFILFENPGRKIKLIALIQFIAGAVLSIIAGIVLMTQGDVFLFFGFLLLLFGWFLFYIPALFLYAIGELVDKMTKTEENTRMLCGATISKNNDFAENKEEEENAYSFSTYSYSMSTGVRVTDNDIAREEDRVEKKSVTNSEIATRFAILQNLLIKGRITKDEYYAELITL